MINTLHIKNVGIIDDITVEFNEGLNILTGETGAGKSLIVDSLQIISGGRFSKEIIRKGQDFSLVEASIYIQDNNDLERRYSRFKRSIRKWKKHLQNRRKTCIGYRAKKIYEKCNRYTWTT